MATHDLQAIATCIESGTPVLLEGAPGVGKTAALNGLARVLKRPIIALIASLHEPSDFNGWPVVHEGAMRFVPPEWVKYCIENPNAIVFFDELTTTPPAVQASLLRVIHEGVVGATALPKTVSFVAAQNSAEHAPGGYELSLPLANRFVHLEWQPNLDEWVTGMLSGWGDPDLTALPANWQDHLPFGNSMVVSFLRSRPSLFLNVPKQDQSKAWPSPRTWSRAGLLLGACRSIGLPFDHEVTSKLVSGAIGTSAAIEFLSYLSNIDLPNPEDLLADPDNSILPTRGDQLYATVTSVVSAVIHNNTPQRWHAGWKVLARVSHDKLDIGASGARLLAKNWPKGQVTAPREARAFKDLLTKAELFGKNN